MKRILALVLVTTLLFSLTACSVDAVESAGTVPTLPASVTGEEPGTVVDSSQNPEIPSSTIAVEYDRDDLDSSVSSAGVSTIELEGNSITVDGSSATVDGNIVTITSAGTYNVRGTLDDGQIIVNTEDEETVRLVLDGADITCSTSTPIYVVNAEKTVITLADGTENVVTDGDSYLFENPASDEPNAAIFSNDDLTINGNGSLTVNASYNNGIASHDDLRITGGTFTVNAANDGLKGRDSIVVRDGVFTINAGGDGMQSNNDEDAEKGYVIIEGGTFNITAGADGIQAETTLTIGGGNITISSSDDSLHSNDSLTINDGNITLASGDDGIHSDATLEINGGDISITKCYEGLESATITINGGNIHLVARDDGINAASGNAGSSAGGRPGGNAFDFSGDNYLYVNGGTIAVDAGGDGLDINGSIRMAGGVVLINGPTSNNNGPLDYLGDFEMAGGFLVAAGSAGMAQAPSTSSTQYSVMVVFPSVLPAGTMVHIEGENGEDILTFVPTKEYQSVVLGSPALSNGSTYTVYTGGSSTGAIADGLYSGGTYTAGTLATSITISSIVTGAGSRGGGFPGGHGGHGGHGGDPGGGRP